LYAITKVKWKFIEGYWYEGNTSLYKLSRPDVILQDPLYNLEEDLGETKNLIGVYPDVARKLAFELKVIKKNNCN